MDNRTLIVALGIIATSYFILFGLLAIKRQYKPFMVFTIGYFFAMGLSLLTYQQGNWHPIFSILLFNMSYFLFLYFLTAGFRVIYGLPVFNKRSYYYFTAFLLLFILFTFIYSHFSFRVILSSLMGLVVIGDTYFSIHESLKEKTPKYTIFAQSFVFIYLGIAILRSAFAIISFKAEGVFIDDDSLTTVSNIFIFISLNLWSIIIFTVEYGQLLNRLKDQNDELSKLALKDSLTGLYNRHFLEHEIERYIQFATSYQQPLSFIMFDLDNFKVVNDVYGHAYGDEVLIKVAKETIKSIRLSDIAYRWGGEEFLIILPNTLISTANEVAEKLRIDIKEAFAEKTGEVTISLGVSEYKTNDSQQSWFRRADFGLSQAKKTGKDKVVVWPTHHPLPLAFATVDWQESWNSGHLEIDKQHKELINLTNELASIALDKENLVQVFHQLDLIIEHVISHFKYEEQILYQIGYDQFDLHQAEHNTLIIRFQKLLEEAKADKITIKNCFDQIAGTLIIGHLLHYDKLFFPLFKE